MRLSIAIDIHHANHKKSVTLGWSEFSINRKPIHPLPTVNAKSTRTDQEWALKLIVNCRILSTASPCKSTAIVQQFVFRLHRKGFHVHR